MQWRPKIIQPMRTQSSRHQAHNLPKRQQWHYRRMLHHHHHVQHIHVKTAHHLRTKEKIWQRKPMKKSKLKRKSPNQVMLRITMKRTAKILRRKRKVQIPRRRRNRQMSCDERRKTSRRRYLCSSSNSSNSKSFFLASKSNWNKLNFVKCGNLNLSPNRTSTLKKRQHQCPLRGFRTSISNHHPIPTNPSLPKKFFFFLLHLPLYCLPKSRLLFHMSFPRRLLQLSQLQHPHIMLLDLLRQECCQQ